MKKLIVLVLLLFFIGGIALLLSQPDTKIKPQKPLLDKTVVADKPSRTEELNQSQTISSEVVDAKTERLSIKESETKKAESTGIDLNIDGNELEQAYVSEGINDNGWKSYWENELFVILMESSRAYPFVKQESDCKSKTCNVEVTLSVERVMYMKQAIKAIDQEFARRKIPIALGKIDLKEGVIGFYVQPGEVR